LLESCERTRSAEARAGLERILGGVLLAPGCPLAPDADVLQAQEDAKQRIASSLWECKLCRKRFRTETFLDKHLSRSHTNVHYGVPRNATLTCLADLCGVAVPCLPSTFNPLPLVSYSRLLGSNGMDHGHERDHDHDLCTDKTEQAARRHVCVDIVRRCVPAGAVSEKARRRLHTALCSDAQRAECMSWEERRSWANRVASGGRMPTYCVVGFTIVAALMSAVFLVRCVKRREESRRSRRKEWRRGMRYAQPSSGTSRRRNTVSQPR
jgi:hypothetical protein